MYNYMLLFDAIREQCPSTQCILKNTIIELRENNIKYQIPASNIFSDQTIKDIIHTWKIITNKE